MTGGPGRNLAVVVRSDAAGPLGQQRMAVLDRQGAHAALGLAGETYLRLITSPGAEGGCDRVHARPPAESSGGLIFGGQTVSTGTS